jgi:hypothetical protein
MQITDNGEAIAAAIKEGKALAVSDGGLKYGLGTAAFVVEGTDMQGRIRGVNEVPGPIKDGDSHRCEVSGLYAVSVLVKEICLLHKIQSGKITVCCDNTTALEIFDHDYLPNPKKPNFDLVSSCWSIKKSSPIQWEAVHVKGHQDRQTPIQELPRKARLNVEMDRVASAYWIHLISRSETMPAPIVRAIYGEEWQLWNGDHKISHPSDKTLYSIFQDPDTDMWWRREGHITAAAREKIDYDATEAVMKSLTAPQRKYITKSASENYGVGRTLVEWKFQSNATCPRCSQVVETPTHVQQCEGYAANEVFKRNISKIEEFLTKEQT